MSIDGASQDIISAVLLFHQCYCSKGMDSGSITCSMQTPESVNTAWFLDFLVQNSIYLETFICMDI
jgi:hypothetical protein